MGKINELLLTGPFLHREASRPEMDPLTEANALQEAQLLDIRFDALSQTVGLLFELRVALQLRDTNTGVLVAHGVTELSWSGRSITDLTAWTVDGSHPHLERGLFSLELGMWPAPGAQLKLEAESAAFFAIDVPGLSEAPPDYTETDRTKIGAEIAGWESPFRTVHASFLRGFASL
ncbi:hypothetical protein [Paenarthrobacter sp. AMU7]|uniref:Uncharacterized protein n=1 Tax=Paenarthrobacter sp. AMU7 TaxID=3162492 RepID=A0AB39YSX9_9MICC